MIEFKMVEDGEQKEVVVLSRSEAMELCKHPFVIPQVKTVVIDGEEVQAMVLGPVKFSLDDLKCAGCGGEVHDPITLVRTSEPPGRCYCKACSDRLIAHKIQNPAFN